ncbi:MAG TPA: carboxypeptidase regulatory-like domain-containing protein [Candidatus Solibacter sp.]
MSEHLHPGWHPDADSLSAFTEGLLPEHERLQCLAHLAECGRCREVVFLAQGPPVATATPALAPAWRRWFAPIPAVAAAAAAALLVVAVSLYVHQTPAPPTRVEIARVEPPPQAPAPAPSPAPAMERAEPKPRSRPKPFLAPPATVAAAQQNSLPQPPIPAESAAVSHQLPLPPADLAIKDPRSTADGRSEIAGSVTDASGAAIPRALLTLRPLSGAPNRDAQTDESGQFKLAGLPPGRYELAINAPGFTRNLIQIELKPQEVATIASQLAVGSVSETVEVTAAASSLQTASASMAETRVRALPSKLSAITTVTSGKITLALDSAGSLFLSRNAGRSWKTVNVVWRGKVTDLVTLPAGTFQLTTEAGSDWLSADGSHWSPAPPAR